MLTVYLLYLDESGTHGGSPVFILGGIAIHEQDAWHLKKRLDGVLSRLLPRGLDPAEFELHAAEMKTPKEKNGKKSVWEGVPYGLRMKIVQSTYASIATYKCRDEQFPVALFGAVVDRREYRDYESRAYEEVLNKFDEMLTRQAHDPGNEGNHQRGLVVHDRQVIENDVQAWARTWSAVAGRIGVLNHLAEVPLFADSRASRLIQASDFVSWGLWRYYGLPTPDERWIKPLWERFDHATGVTGTMHGLIHVSPNFRKGCHCPPCESRVAPAPKASPPAVSGG